MASLEEKFASVNEVDIDESGKFKYILIRIFAGSASKFIVRGYDWAEFHGMYRVLFHRPIGTFKPNQGAFHVVISIVLLRHNRADLLKNSLILGISVTHTPRSRVFPMYAKSFF